MVTADTLPVPEVAVAVPTRDRPLRLRWLLNALSDQTLPHERFEVIVAHDSSSPEVERLLQTHQLHQQGVLRHFSFPRATKMAGAKRNVAWRAARAMYVLFTDDDCRPAPDWLEQALLAWRTNPGVIIQGTTIPDPQESVILRSAPWAHTVLINPPTTWAETCNIGYPRALLERLEGFDEERRVGEDSDLALRAAAQGVQVVPVHAMLVRHAVQERSLPAAVRSQARWEDMAWLVKRHPQARRSMYGRIWWVPEHAALALAIAGLLLLRRTPAAALLSAPWLSRSLRHRGHTPRGVARSISELPGRAAIDGAGILALARASVRNRTVLL